MMGNWSSCSKDIPDLFRYWNVLWKRCFSLPWCVASVSEFDCNLFSWHTAAWRQRREDRTHKKIRMFQRSSEGANIILLLLLDRGYTRLPIPWLTWYLWSQLSAIVFACPFTKWIVLPPPFNNTPPPVSMAMPLLLLQNDRVRLIFMLWNCDAGDNGVGKTAPLRLLRWWGQSFNKRRLCCDHHMAYWLLFTFCTVRSSKER